MNKNPLGPDPAQAMADFIVRLSSALAKMLGSD